MLRRILYFKPVLFLYFCTLYLHLTGCSSKNDYLTNFPVAYYNSADFTITTQETTLPMDVTLQLGQSVYIEACDIKVEFYALYKNYQAYNNDRVIIYITDIYGKTMLEYDTKNGVFKYEAENGYNFVFYFKSLHSNEYSYEIVFTINRYGTL